LSKKSNNDVDGTFAKKQRSVMSNQDKISPKSLVASAGHYMDTSTGAIVPPVQTSTTFARNEAYELPGDFSYGRDQNPTYVQAEKLLQQLEQGAGARLFSSGMAAFAAVFETLNSGDHVIAPKIMYHGGQSWLRRIAKRRNIGLSLVDQSDLSAIKNAIQPGKTKIVWIENPANPTWDICDIAAAADIAHAAGACLGVDNTVATPVTTQPLLLGADIVFHSATKYLNGHSDVLAGALVTRECDARWEEIGVARHLGGGILGSFEAWLLLRGMRTLFVRHEHASNTAMMFAHHFEHHPKIDVVLYPGLESDPGHEIARFQMTYGFSGMMSLLVKGGAEQAKKIATSTRLFIPATSLGGVESLI
jgi:cystathionine gamma-synthase